MTQTGDTHDSSRLIDTWFPCPEVDEAVKKPEGSGLSEKALFTWFASRPIAQARAAVLTTLLPDEEPIRRDIRAAVLTGNQATMERLREEVRRRYPDKAPVVLDLFSGRGIIPLEAARAGATAVGSDLSPVATLAGRLLADYPFRNWDNEPPLPLGSASEDSEASGTLDFGSSASSTPRLIRDVEAVITEVQSRVSEELAPYFPGDQQRAGEFPWAYLWAVTIPCDRCGRRFPLLGSLVLRHPYSRTGDVGQCLVVDGSGDELAIEVSPGKPSQTPLFASPTGKKGKSARCPFNDCGHTHNLDVVKSKGFAGQFEDMLVAVAEVEPGPGSRKVFRKPTRAEVDAPKSIELSALPALNGYSAIPDEPIPAGNKDNVRASGYGYETYGSLMNARQALRFAVTARTISEIRAELAETVSADYANALAAYAASNIIKQVRYATRGAAIQAKGRPDGSGQNRVMVDHIFSSQSVVKHQFDYLETGIGNGPGTWLSVSKGLLRALERIDAGDPDGAAPARIRRASATALPFRDSTIDLVVTDPPYYDMIAYADSSDIFYVWLKRALGDAMPDIFGPDVADSEGLQDKSDEIIVKGRGAKGAGDPRSSEERYERLLSDAFAEARRVLKADGRMTVIFGHSDPEAWKRLLTALTDAGFVVTSSWPSRTETAVTGVATISVTVSIGCLVAPGGRPVGIAAQVDADVLDEVMARCKQWDEDGLALEDQQMAAYGAALSVVGRYERVITPNGDTMPLEHYMTLARKAVRQSVAMRLDSLPLETFDALTRFAVFWMELYGRADVPKGEAKFFALSDELRIEDLRDRIVAESSKGFRIRYDAPQSVSRTSSTFEVVRAMATAWPNGTEAVARVIEASETNPTDHYLWAVADWLATKLPASDPVSGALAAIKRNKPAIQGAVGDNMAMLFGSES
jgi:adenine-specific DNA methylase